MAWRLQEPRGRRRWRQASKSVATAPSCKAFTGRLLVRLRGDRGAAAGGRHLAGTTPTRPARRRSCPVLRKAAPLPVAPPLAKQQRRVHARPGPVPGQPHYIGHDPSRPSSHPRSGPERHSKAPVEEGGLDTTTPIRSLEPRRRSMRPHQAAAELDPEAGHHCRGSTTGPANPPPPRASPVTRSPYAAAPQPTDEREAAIGHGRDGLGNRIVQLLQMGVVTSVKEKREMGSTERTPGAGREGGVVLCDVEEGRERRTWHHGPE